MGPGMMKGMGHGMGPGMMNGPGMGPGMMKGMGPGMMHGRAGLGFADPAAIESLKSELGITPAQEHGLDQVRQGRAGRRSDDEDDAGGRRS